MIVVAGLWELGYNTPILEIDLWKYPLRDFGVDHLAMTPISGISDKFVKEYVNIEEMLGAYELPIVVVDERGETNLRDFNHPNDCLYLFGKATYSPLNQQFSKGQSVRIDTIQNKGMLWPHQAASIILYDRLLKNGNNNSR